jgi:hypothetical protein
MQTYGGVEVYLHRLLISALEGDEWPASRPVRFTAGDTCSNRFKLCALCKYAPHNFGKGEVFVLFVRYTNFSYLIFDRPTFKIADVFNLRWASCCSWHFKISLLQELKFCVPVSELLLGAFEKSIQNPSVRFGMSVPVPASDSAHACETDSVFCGTRLILVYFFIMPMHLKGPSNIHVCIYRPAIRVLP